MKHTKRVLDPKLKRLVQARKDQKHKQQKVAKELKITSTTLSRYETGEREMPRDKFEKYAEYLGFEIRMLTKE